MAMVKLSIRVEPEFYRELKKISEVTGEDLSTIVRDLLKIGYVVMRPDVTIHVRELITFLVPRAVDYIKQKEMMEAEQKENGENSSANATPVRAGTS